MISTQAALQQDINNICQFFQSSIIQLEQTEQTLIKKASALSQDIKQTSSFFNEHVETLNFTHRVHTTLKADRSFMEYVRNGVCIGGFAGFDAVNIHADKKMKYLQTGAEVCVGSAKVNADAKALLFQNGKIDPSLHLEANASVALAQAKAYLNIGNSYVSAKGEAVVKTGCAQAEAKAVIGKDEITLKANVGAAAVRGEVKGTFSIFGIKITASASGEIGSVGAGAEFSSKKGEFEIGTSASLFAGLGFKIRVNYG